MKFSKILILFFLTSAAFGQWSRHSTRNGDNSTLGKFKSIVSLPSGGTTPAGDPWLEDQVYCVVERVVDGNTVTTIEEFTPLDWGTNNDYAWFVDGGGTGMQYQPGQAAIPGSKIPGDYTEFFVGHYNNAGGPKGSVVTNTTTASTIDTTWGTNGFWGYTDPNTSNYTTYCSNLYQLDDGSLFVIFDNLWVDVGNYAGGGKLCSLAKLTSAGVLDTSWGYNGFYPMSYGPSTYNYPMTNSYQLLECTDGSFILFGFGSGSNIYCLHKISADGDMVLVREYDKWPPTATIPYIGNTYVACWSDSNETSLLVFSQANNRGLAGCWSNVVALDPDTFELDPNWVGLMEFGTQYDGYGAFPSPSSGSIPLVYNVVTVSDGFILAHAPSNFGGTLYTLTKMNSDWSAYDTTWGTNGHVATTGIFGFGPPQQNQICKDENENIYMVTSDFGANPDIQYVEKFDSTGTLGDSKTFDSGIGTPYVYQLVQCIDDYVYLGTLDADPAYDDIEKWDSSFTYQSGFDVGSSTTKYVLIPDESSREWVVTPETPAVPEAWVEGDGLNFDEVCVYADGVPHGTFTMDGNDIVDFNEAAHSVVISGLNYWSKLETMPLVIPGNEPNTVIADKQITAIKFDLQDSYFMSYAMGKDATVVDCNFGGITNSVVTYERVAFPFGSRAKATVFIKTDEPVPLGIRGMVPEVTFFRPK